MARSPRLSRASRAAILLIAAAMLPSVRAGAQLGPIQADASLLQAPRTLQLDVLINGVPTNYVAPFVLTAAEPARGVARRPRRRRHQGAGQRLAEGDDRA